MTLANPRKSVGGRSVSKPFGCDTYVDVELHCMDGHTLLPLDGLMEGTMGPNLSSPYDRLIDKYDSDEDMMNSEGLNPEDIYEERSKDDSEWDGSVEEEDDADQQFDLGNEQNDDPPYHLAKPA